MTNGYEKLADTLYQAVSGFVAREFGRLFQSEIGPLKKSIESLPTPKDGKDGESVSKDEVRKMVEELVSPFLANVQLPRDGRDGQKGEPGKDALDIEPESMIDESKSYPRRTWATHKGGLWRAVKSTSGMDGWECVVDGVSSIAAVQDPEDPRRIALGIKMASGIVVQEEMHIPFVIDKGVFKEGTEYKAGDGVTWARNYWIAQKDTDQKPDFGGDFRLAVKGGRDGRDGRDGIDKTAAVKLS